MSVVINEKSIPVIGVPKPPPKASLATPNIIISPEKPVIPVAKTISKLIKKQQAKANKQKLVPVNPNDLITTTGNPPSENGNYVKEAEKNLSNIEQKALKSYLAKKMNKKDVKSKTPKQQKKHEFKLRLVWLLNKTVMMKSVDRGQIARQLTQEGINRAKKKQEKNSQNNEQPEINEEKAKPRPLMDIFVQPVEGRDMNETSIYSEGNSDYQSGLSGYQGLDRSGGYQYLDDNWINADKPWRSFQSSSDFNSFSAPSMSSAAYPITDTTQFPPPVFNYAPTTPFPTYKSGIPTATSFQPMPTSFNNPPPAFPSFQTNQPSTEYVSLYRQQFPIQEQLAPQQNLQFKQSPSPVSSSPYVPTTAEVLEVSEEELARQRRLMEIEEELRMINARKLQMQMEDEIHEREFQLSQQSRMVAYRERELRDREYHESRSRYGDRGGHSPYVHDYSLNARRPETRRSPEYDDHHRHNSYSSSSSRHQISIERNAAAADAIPRRHGGRNDKLPGETKRGGGEGSLKRQAEPRSSQYDNNGKSGRIQPAKKPRHRNNKATHDDLPMQAISDDED